MSNVTRPATGHGSASANPSRRAVTLTLIVADVTPDHVDDRDRDQPEREFHRIAARELIRLHRLHKGNDEHYEAQECLDLARLHTEHVLGCWRSSDPRATDVAS